MSAPTPIPVPKGFQRLGPFPLDPTSVFASLADLTTYAASGTAYQGQICAVAETTGTRIFEIGTAGSLIELAEKDHTHPAFTYGSPGFVPNSFGSDAVKFLRGDGTWSTPSAAQVGAQPLLSSEALSIPGTTPVALPSKNKRFIISKATAPDGSLHLPNFADDGDIIIVDWTQSSPSTSGQITISRLGGNPSVQQIGTIKYGQVFRCVWLGLWRVDTAPAHTHSTADLTDTLPISKGGTGATTGEGACDNLGAVAREDVSGGSSSYFERNADAASQSIGYGQSVHQIVLANDTRLTNSRTATAHKTTHSTGGSDALTPSDIGAQPSGSYATLVSGKVPSDQLPSYVDDVLEFANLAAFPATGESGKIYVTQTTPPKAYRWSGTTYIEISPSEVTSVSGKTGAVTLFLEDLSNFSSLSGTAYKLTAYSHTVTANNADSLSVASVRAQAWTVTFSAPRTVDFFLPNTLTAGGQTIFAPQLGDIVTFNFLTGQNSTPWTARFKRPDLSIFFTVTSADSDLKKSNLRFVYNGTAWELDKAPWHQHSYSEILDTPPDVATGYFDRSGNATSRPGNLGQAPHQVVLSNDTRLLDPRRTAWVTKPASPTTVVSGAEAGTMAYDGSFLYILVPTPGSQSLRWARTPLSMTW